MLNLKSLPLSRLERFRLPAAVLAAVCQRTPAVRIAVAAADYVLESPVVVTLRSVAASVAVLGAVDSLAGASASTAVLVADITVPATATAGQPFKMNVTVTGAGVTFAQSWDITNTLPPGITAQGATLNGNLLVINNAISANGLLTISGVPTKAGTYNFTVNAWQNTNRTGSVTPGSTSITVIGNSGTAPVIVSQPAIQTVEAGSTVTLSVTASGSPTPTYQWKKDGVAIAGATSSSLTLSPVKLGDAGIYAVVATNSLGSATSNNALLTVNPPLPAAPIITVQPLSQTVAVGGSVTFGVTATGTNLTYQWQKNGAAIAGATASTLTLANLQPGDAAYYTVVVTTSGSPATSRFAQLVVDTPNPGRIANLSVRAPAGVGGQSLTVGFIVSGGSKSLLIRASGPTLGALGVPGTLPDPILQVHQKINGQDVVVASNDNWGLDPNAAAIAAIPGPFPFLPGSKDAALLLSVDSDRTALVGDVNNVVGVTLVEVYDVGTGNSPRLVNVSTLNFSGTGDSVLIAGFIVSGNTPKTLLIRGVGPTIGSAPFNVGGTLTDPVMEIHTTINGQDVVVAKNDDWGSEPNAAAAAAIPGPFALNVGSKDAALLITLPAGAYTVQVAGVNQTTGNALIEIYDVQ